MTQLISSILMILAGILILVFPKIIPYTIAIFFLIVGIMGIFSYFRP